MTVMVWIFALLAALIHFLAFVWESLLFRRDSVHRGVFAIPSEDVRPVLLWAFNVGFYNLFLGCGMIAGVTGWAAGNVSVGPALITYLCVFMVLAGLVLFISDRLALSRPRGSGVWGSISQAGPPLITLIALQFIP